MISITGIGAVSSCGSGIKSLVEHMHEGRDSSTPLSLFPLPFKDEIRVNQVKSAPSGDEGSRIDALVLNAMEEAIAEAGLNKKKLSDSAFILGSSGFLFEAEEEYRQQKEKGITKPAPLARRGSGHVASRLAKQLGIQGPVLTLTTACTSSANAMIAAANMLKSGEVRRAVIVGAEALSTITLSGFRSLMLLAPNGCKPFDAKRQGIQLGEAYAVLILEPNKPAKNKVCGWANLCDTHNVISTNMDGRLIQQTMAGALSCANINPGQVIAVKAHGTGTIDNDTAEGAGMRLVFDSKAPPFTALKGYVGHTLGACGAIETAAFLGCLNSGFIPPAIGFDQQDPSIGISPIKSPMEALHGYYMLNFFGFGGNNTSLVLSYG